MAGKPHTTTEDREQPGFNVVCTIGRIEFGEGDVSPYEAAFSLIGRHGADGDYEFPAEDGGTVFVFVTSKQHP